METNKDKGTTVGFSKLSKEDWNDIANGRDNDDFCIEENLKVIESNEWDDIIELYCNEIKFELGEVKHVVVPLLHWLRENYLAPEKK